MEVFWEFTPDEIAQMSMEKLSVLRMKPPLPNTPHLPGPLISQGNFDTEERRLTKNGNRYPRYYLILVANSLRVHNEEYRAYYQTNYREVTKLQHKSALALTARKLAGWSLRHWAKTKSTERW